MNNRKLNIDAFKIHINVLMYSINLNETEVHLKHRKKTIKNDNNKT